MEEDTINFLKNYEQIPNFLHELTLLEGIKNYFSSLRLTKGHNPEGSPIDLEILLLLKLIYFCVENPIQTLFSLGIILVGDQIAINANFLKICLSTCRSRINNSMKNLGWNLINISNNDKFEILQPLVDRKDSRNWTLRLIPSISLVHDFIKNNPRVKLRDISPPSEPDSFNKDIINNLNEIVQ